MTFNLIPLVSLLSLSLCSSRDAAFTDKPASVLAMNMVNTDSWQISTNEVLFTESFDEQYSFSEDHSNGSSMSDEQDDGEDDWAKGPNIELGGVQHRENDTLTLEEMNG